MDGRCFTGLSPPSDVNMELIAAWAAARLRADAERVIRHRTAGHKLSWIASDHRDENL